MITNTGPLLTPFWQSLVSGSVGSGLITLGLFWIKNYSDRIERTFSLHREFSSLEFVRVRDRAYTLLVKHDGKTFADLARLAVNDERIDADLTCLLRLATFYEHLSISVNSGFLNRKLACSYFGMVFYWWNKNFLSKPEGIPSTSWELACNIQALEEFFESKATKAELASWTKNAYQGPFLLRHQKASKQTESGVQAGSHSPASISPTP